MRRPLRPIAPPAHSSSSTRRAIIASALARSCSRADGNRVRIAGHRKAGRPNPMRFSARPHMSGAVRLGESR
jgi:hypothetical protein